MNCVTLGQNEQMILKYKEILKIVENIVKKTGRVKRAL